MNSLALERPASSNASRAATSQGFRPRIGQRRPERDGGCRQLDRRRMCVGPVGVEAEILGLVGSRLGDVGAAMADVDADKLPGHKETQRLAKIRKLALEQEKVLAFTSAAERLRAEDLQREREATGRYRPGLNHNDQDIADALYQLERGGMRMADTIRGKPTVERRQEIRQEMDTRIEPPPAAVPAVRKPEPERA